MFRANVGQVPDETLAAWWRTRHADCRHVVEASLCERCVGVLTEEDGTHQIYLCRHCLAALAIRALREAVG